MTSKTEIPYSFCTSVLSLVVTSAVCVPMFLSCPGQRRGLGTQGWAGQRVHGEETTQRLLEELLEEGL